MEIIEILGVLGKENLNMDSESLSFDKQIIDRIKHGFVPDIQNMKRNEWFKNNVWRDPFFADMFFGEVVRRIFFSIKKYCKKKENINILEACCGPGHISLELARKGHNVTGVDISCKNIDLAQDTANKDDYIRKNKNIKYICSDIMKYNTDDKYDLILFCNSLHHFGDLKSLLKKIDKFLNDDGIIFITDPTKNNLTISDAIIIHAFRGLLSLGDIYFEKIKIPQQEDGFLEEITKIKQEFSYKDANHKNLQSPFDGSSTYSEMSKWLREFFTELEISNDFSFFDKIVAGVRTDSLEKDKRVAIWLKHIDKVLTNNNVITPKQFTFVGKKI